MQVFQNTISYLNCARRGDRIALMESKESKIIQPLSKHNVLTVFEVGPRTVKCKSWRQHKAKSLRTTQLPIAVLSEAEYQQLPED